MRKPAVLLAVVLAMLAFAQAGQAVEIEAVGLGDAVTRVVGCLDYSFKNWIYCFLQ